MRRRLCLARRQHVRCPMSNTKIATMFGSHARWGKRRLAVPGGRMRWGYGCCFAAKTARRGRGRPSAERPRQRRGYADQVRARRVVGCLRVPNRLSLHGKISRTALRESGKPSAAAGDGFPGMTISGTAAKFREFAAGGVLLCADWVKIRDSRRRRLR